MGYRAIVPTKTLTFNDLMADDPPYIEEAAIGRPSYLYQNQEDARPVGTTSLSIRITDSSKLHEILKSTAIYLGIHLYPLYAIFQDNSFQLRAQNSTPRDDKDRVDRSSFSNHL